MSPGSEEVVKEVSSWVHDEQRCVSIGGVAQTFGISRTEAQRILEGIATNDDNCNSNSSKQPNYQATYCQVRRDDSEDATCGVPTTGECMGSNFIAYLYTVLRYYHFFWFLEFQTASISL